MGAELTRATLLARGGKVAAAVVGASALCGLTSRAAVARLGVRLESLSLGAYLGAVRSLSTPLYREHAARAAASEAQHLSVFAASAGGRRLGPALPAALPIDRVSDALDEFTS
jgi:hypothetical protein